MYICNCIWIYHSNLHKKTCRCYNNPLNVKFRNKKLQNKHVLKTHSTVRNGVSVHNPWPNLKPCRLMCSDITANTCRRPRFIREPWSAPRSQEECSIVAICWKNKGDIEGSHRHLPARDTVSRTRTPLSITAVSRRPSFNNTQWAFSSIWSTFIQCTLSLPISKTSMRHTVHAIKPAPCVCVHSFTCGGQT